MTRRLQTLRSRVIRITRSKYQMSESKTHKRIKNKMAGSKGKTEVKLRSGRRLDALSGNRVGTEVERQGPRAIGKAVGRLKEAKRTGVALGVKLSVPQKDINTGISEMKKQGVPRRVQNLGNTRSTYVRPSSAKPNASRGRRSRKDRLAP